MTPRPPDYSQERIQRERKQHAKAEEKAERIAERTVRRRAARDERKQPFEFDDSKPS